MTVKELIEKLRSLPPDMIVLFGPYYQGMLSVDTESIADVDDWDRFTTYAILETEV